MRPALVGGVLAALGAVCPGARGEEREIPLPVGKGTILREEGVVYTVEGRVRIPKGVIIACQKDVKIRAKGKTTPAVVEVEGSFEVHGTGAREVIFEGVSVEPQAQFEQIQLEACIFRGGSVRTAPNVACRGRMRLQGVSFDNVPLDLTLGDGCAVDLFEVNAGTVRLTGAGAGAAGTAGKVTLRGCGVVKSLVAHRVADLTVRINRLSGVTEFRDCADLVFDGNKVESPQLVFEQTRPGGFAKTSIMKCDLYCKAVVFKSPPSDSGDFVVMDKCWFEGRTDRDAVAAIVKDKVDDAKTGVRVTVRNPQERPLELAGAVNR